MKTDNQSDLEATAILEAAIISAFDAYTKATKGREMADKEIALVLRPISGILYTLDNA